MGFQATALPLVCMMILRTGVEERRSYKAMPRSLPVVAKISGSAGLNRAEVMVSEPHVNVETGSERA